MADLNAGEGPPDSVTIEQATRVAMTLHREGKLAEAEVLYRRVLEAAPEYPDALHFLGLLRRQQGEVDEAVELMRKAIAASPDYGSAHNNLGNLLHELGRFDEARESLTRAMDLSPEDVRVMNNLGSTEEALGNSELAKSRFESAIALAPDFALPHENLGRHYYRLGLVAKAHDCFCNAVVRDPSLSHSRQFMGMALCQLGKLEEAASHYRRWSVAEPDNPLPRHLLNAALGTKLPPRAPDDYVRTVFDLFAGTFDAHLRRLQYRAPQLVMAGLVRHCAPGTGEGDRGPEPRYDILDAGCGTGLCGLLLRPWARRLAGVDLSPGMLEKAKATGAYDSLAADELTRFALDHPGAFDWIACADTLCYFGEIDAALSAMHRALRRGGLFAFTVERFAAAEGTDGFRLDYSGRYAHADGFIAAQVVQSGLVLKEMAVEVLRMEAGTRVEGLVVVAMRT